MNRLEVMCIKLELNKDQVEKYIDEIIAIDPTIKIMFKALEADDTLTLTYNFLIEYLQNCNKKLKIILKLLQDVSVVCDADFYVLNHTSCLLQDIVENINKINERI